MCSGSSEIWQAVCDDPVGRCPWQFGPLLQYPDMGSLVHTPPGLLPRTLPDESEDPRRSFIRLEPQSHCESVNALSSLRRDSRLRSSDTGCDGYCPGLRTSKWSLSPPDHWASWTSNAKKRRCWPWPRGEVDIQGLGDAQTLMWRDVSQISNMWARYLRFRECQRWNDSEASDYQKKNKERAKEASRGALRERQRVGVSQTRPTQPRMQGRMRKWGHHIER